MASIGKCPYCGGAVRSDAPKCPHCGGANEGYVPPASRLDLRPQTIRELQDWCLVHKLPLEKLRFFIGEDYRRPRAYGIYREGGNFVIYKNKSDGSRSVPYRGPDEAFAVRALYEKLLEEGLRLGLFPEKH